MIWMKTHPLYIINIRLGRQHTMGLSKWQPAIGLFMSLYCNLPMAHDMNDAWYVKGRPHHLGNFRYSFPKGVWVVLRPLWFDQRKREERDKANGFKSPPNDAILWTEIMSQITISMVLPAFLRPWWLVRPWFEPTTFCSTDRCYFRCSLESSL